MLPCTYISLGVSLEDERVSAKHIGTLSRVMNWVFTFLKWVCNNLKLGKALVFA